MQPNVGIDNAELGRPHTHIHTHYLYCVSAHNILWLACTLVMKVEHDVVPGKESYGQMTWMGVQKRFKQSQERLVLMANNRRIRSKVQRMSNRLICWPLPWKGTDWAEAYDVMWIFRVPFICFIELICFECTVFSCILLHILCCWERF